MSNICSTTMETKITEGTSLVIADRSLPFDDSTITQYVDDQVTIPANSTDLLVSMASVGTAKYLMCDFSGPVTVKLNANTNTGIALNNPATNGAWRLMLTGCAITALYVTSGSTAVTLKRIAAS